MKITRLYSGTDGESHFESLGEITCEERAQLGRLSQIFNAKGMQIHEYGPEFREDWHNPPLGPIYVIFLEGEQEIEVGDGTKHIFSYGDMLLIENMTGRGHRTRAISKNGGKSIILLLDGKTDRY